MPTARQQLDNLADAFVEDIMALSDEEVLAEFIEDHGDPEQHEAEMRALIASVVATTAHEQETPSDETIP